MTKRLKIPEKMTKWGRQRLSWTLKQIDELKERIRNDEYMLRERRKEAKKIIQDDERELKSRVVARGTFKSEKR